MKSSQAKTFSTAALEAVAQDGLTIKQLAQKTGRSRQAVSQVINGRRNWRFVRHDIAKALKLPKETITLK